ncbi:MAG: hypothetical protein DRP34_04840, partial [Thermodesulfobacteriota bacterium]
SGAGGPALAGGIFECGSQAKKGAIETVKIDLSKKVVEYQTIGNTPMSH